MVPDIARRARVIFRDRLRARQMMTPDDAVIVVALRDAARCERSQEAEEAIVDLYWGE